MWPHVHLLGREFSTYGLLTSMSYAIGALWLARLRSEMKAPEDTLADFWAMIYSLFLGALIGGRLGYYLVEWRSFAAHPLAMILQWRNGWVFWGGALGSIGAGLIFVRIWNRTHRPRRYLPVADYFGFVAPLCHAIGRVGCFVGGCCYGSPTSVPWGVRFQDPTGIVPRRLLGTPLHPTQLYEAAGDVLIFIFLYFFMMKRVREKRFTAGSVFLSWIILYSILRFVIEFFRGDDRGMLISAALSPSQWISLGALAGASVILWRQGLVELHPEKRSPYLA
ncbi:MAG: prolipoprotein diacylglyceryl transferase [Elusimicrobia bacterium]|nr:prolipoprotein diacylglyceryl transferase [Elusimicrobiota bacterium]